MTTFALGPFALFDRPLRDEELPTLHALDDWSYDMGLTPTRGVAELSRTPVNPRHLLTAPRLAQRYERLVRRDRG